MARYELSEPVRDVQARKAALLELDCGDELVRDWTGLFSFYEGFLEDPSR